MSDNSFTNVGFSGNNRYSSYYGPGGRLVFVDSALEAVNKGSTTIGIKTPNFAIISSQIKPTRPLVEPSEKIFSIDDHVGAQDQDTLEISCNLSMRLDCMHKNIASHLKLR